MTKEQVVAEAGTYKAADKLEEVQFNARSQKSNSEGYGVLSLSKKFKDTTGFQKDITVSSLDSNEANNRPGPSSLLEALEYKSEFLQRLGLKVITNYKEDNFTVAHTGNVFGLGTSDSALTIKNSPFTTKEFAARITIDRDTARRMPRGSEGAFNFNDPSQTAAFRGLVSSIIAMFPANFEDWAFNGDTTSGTPLLAIGDGLLKNASDTYAVSGALDISAIRTALKTQLDDGAATSDGLLVMAPSASFNNLKNVHGAKATALGDRTQMTGNPMIDNSEVIWCPKLASTTALIGNVGPGRNIQGAIEDDVVIELLKVGKNYELYVYFYVDVIALEKAKMLKLTGISE